MGWNGSDGKTVGSDVKAAAKNKAKRKGTGVFLGLAIMAVGCGVAWYFRDAYLPKTNDGDDVQEVATRHIKDAQREPGRAGESRAAPDAAEEETSEAEPVFTDGRTSEWSMKFSKDSKWTSTTNTLGEVIEVVRDGGKVHKRRSLSRPPLFRNQVDQAIAMIICRDPNAPIPPFPVRNFSDEEVRAALDSEIVIDPNEPYELQLKKADVINAREEVRKMLDSGMSFAEIINQSRDEQNDDIDLRREVLSGIRDLVEAGDEEGAEEYRLKANEILRERGIEEISAAEQ